MQQERWQTVASESYKPVGKAMEGMETKHRNQKSWVSHYSTALAFNKSTTLAGRGW